MEKDVNKASVPPPLPGEEEEIEIDVGADSPANTDDDWDELDPHIIDKLAENELLSKRYDKANSSTQVIQVITDLVATTEDLEEVTRRVGGYIGGKFKPSVAPVKADEEEGVVMKDGRRVRVVVMTPDCRTIEVGRKKIMKNK